jgi:hypothetical protein
MTPSSALNSRPSVVLRFSSVIRAVRKLQISSYLPGPVERENVGTSSTLTVCGISLPPVNVGTVAQTPTTVLHGSAQRKSSTVTLLQMTYALLSRRLASRLGGHGWGRLYLRPPGTVQLTEIAIGRNHAIGLVIWQRYGTYVISAVYSYAGYLIDH